MICRHTLRLSRILSFNTVHLQQCDCIFVAYHMHPKVNKFIHPSTRHDGNLHIMVMIPV